MYYKIIEVGDPENKYVNMGMINITAEFYLEPGDEGFDVYKAEHYVFVPLLPVGGYPGSKDMYGQPVDEKDYADWIKKLPTVQQINPFCEHNIQFEADVSVEEILWCFEWALKLTHANYLKQDLHCQKKDKDGKPMGKIVNQPFGYSNRRAFYQGVVTIPDTDRTAYMKAEMLKVTMADTKVAEFKVVDFTKAKTMWKYSVK